LTTETLLPMLPVSSCAKRIQNQHAIEQKCAQHACKTWSWCSWPCNAAAQDAARRYGSWSLRAQPAKGAGAGPSKVYRRAWLLPAHTADSTAGVALTHFEPLCQLCVQPVLIHHQHNISLQGNTTRPQERVHN
jgi:hypothetical protein